MEKSSEPEREKRNVAIEDSLDRLDDEILGLENVINQIKEVNVLPLGKPEEKLPVRSMAELVEQLPSHISRFAAHIDKQSARLTDMFL